MTDIQTDDATDKPLPQAVDAERAVLGSILISNTAFFSVRLIVDVEDFYRDSHKLIYRAMSSLSHRGREIDLLTVTDALESDGDLRYVGASYVASLIDGIPDVTHVERYAEIVSRQAKLRAIILACNDGMRRAYDAEESPTMIGSEIASRLQAAASDEARESRPVYDVVIEVVERAKKRAEEGRSRAIVTGFKSLDYHAVVRRKALIVVGAPTSHGKTTLMLNFAIGTVKHDAQITSAVYSIEMSDEDMVDPIRSMVSGVRLTNIQDGRIDEQEAIDLEGAHDWLRSRRARFFFADRIRDIDALYADCRKRKATRGLDAVFVDYLQLVKGFDERTREQDVDRIARALFLMSQDLDCAVVTGSQVNKEREKRSSGRLSVMDLKHGAVIGEHARVVLLFQRPRQDDKANNDVPWCKTVFQIEKNSGRQTGDVLMHADMAIQRFGEGGCEMNHCRFTNQPSEKQLNFG